VRVLGIPRDIWFLSALRKIMVHSQASLSRPTQHGSIGTNALGG